MQSKRDQSLLKTAFIPLVSAHPLSILNITGYDHVAWRLFYPPMVFFFKAVLALRKQLNALKFVRRINVETNTVLHRKFGDITTSKGIYYP